MTRAKIYLFTSPTCPSCPPAKNFMSEFKKERDDAVFSEYSTITSEGRKLARKFNVMSVPTFIIIGPGYPTPIGLRGIQSTKSMNKYIDMSLGLVKEDKKKGLFDKLKELF